jgi:hypothetical protein
MEAARSSEMLVNFYQTTRRYNPEDSHLHLHTRRRENLKSHQFAAHLDTVPPCPGHLLYPRSCHFPRHLRHNAHTAYSKIELPLPILCGLLACFVRIRRQSKWNRIFRHVDQLVSPTRSVQSGTRLKVGQRKAILDCLIFLIGLGECRGKYVKIGHGHFSLYLAACNVLQSFVVAYALRPSCKNVPRIGFIMFVCTRAQLDNRWTVWSDFVLKILARHLTCFVLVVRGHKNLAF